MPNNVIEVKNLTKTYQTGKNIAFEAVKSISFAVEKAEIFGILGPNGAGKTTTLEIIEGLNKQTSGTVEVLGMDNIKNAQKIRHRIGVQLQSSEYLPYLTLGEQIGLFKSLYRSPENNPSSPLNLVGLKEKERELVKSLSGGQKQRFTIATALVHNPDILFLDEPTTGLDPSARRQMWELIKALNAKGMTIVLTTHYMEEAEFLCHRVAIMDQGKILEIDEPRKLVENLSRTTQISFLTKQNIDQAIFKDIPQISKIYSHYPKTILEVASLDHISEILNRLKNNGIIFSSFTVKTATLEDVYLDLTGKEYEES